MTSNDADAITIQLRELIAVNKEQIAEMKTLAAQMQRDNAEFHALMIKEFSDFKAEQNARFDAFAEKQDAKFDTFTEKQDAKFASFRSEIRQDFTNLRQDMKELKAEVVVIQRDLEGIKHDVAALFHWDYWILTFIAAALFVPHLSEIMKTLVGAVSQGVSAVASLFRKGKNYDA